MSSQGTRERTLEPLELKRPQGTSDYSGKTQTYDPPLFLGGGKQITVSESHPRRPDGSYDGGGPFYTSRVEITHDPGWIDHATYGNSFWYTGPVLCNQPTLTELSHVGFDNPTLQYGDKNESSLSDLGTTAIAQCAPTNPTANLGVALAEFKREGFPSLPGIQAWRNRTQKLKALGSEYLNYQFGWAPLVKDVKDTAEAVRFHHTILSQYRKDEGSNVRREFHFPSSTDSDSYEVGTQQPGSPGVYLGPYLHFGGPQSVRSLSRVSTTKRWFSGCFTYGGPSNLDSYRKALGYRSDADKLFGISLTPDILWELTPWSWAADWFSNTGDLIHNISNFALAGLVMRYGYMMEESIEEVTAHQSPQAYLFCNEQGSYQGWHMSTPASCTIKCVTKRRYPASPFGFGIGWEGLSPTQLAITAAVGITKLL